MKRNRPDYLGWRSIRRSAHIDTSEQLCFCVSELKLKDHAMAERDAFTLRLRPDLLRFVQDAADEENRSVPNFVETVLIAEKRRREAQVTSPAKAE